MGTRLEGTPLSSAYLDTHVAAWLYFGLDQQLTDAAVREIEESDLLLSPMVVLELRYLWKKKTIAIEPRLILAYLHTTFQIGVCALPFIQTVNEAMDLHWTTDPFDRLIVANAAAGSAPLITADRKIRENYKGAIW